MIFVLDKDNEDYIPPNCTSISLKDASKLIFLCTFLRCNATVKGVDLLGNFIGDKGAKLITEVLKVNRTITKLDLRLNKIGVDGAKAIAEALKVNCTITELDLSWNEIGKEGEKAITEALKVNCTVTKLNLWVFKARDPEAIDELVKANNFIYEELKQVTMNDQCKTMALGLLQTIPIYVLLDIHELVVILDLERKTNSHKYYNNHSFLKLLEKAPKKRLLSLMDKINRRLI